MENVIMCDRKRLTVKLCDFGLSTFTKRGETLVTRCGTMMYGKVIHKRSNRIGLALTHHNLL